jgi:hypothetical protein
MPRTILPRCHARDATDIPMFALMFDAIAIAVAVFT